MFSVTDNGKVVARGYKTRLEALMGMAEYYKSKKQNVIFMDIIEEK